MLFSLHIGTVAVLDLKSLPNESRTIRPVSRWKTERLVRKQGKKWIRVDQNVTFKRNMSGPSSHTVFPIRHNLINQCAISFLSLFRWSNVFFFRRLELSLPPTMAKTYTTNSWWNTAISSKMWHFGSIFWTVFCRWVPFWLANFTSLLS